MGSALTRRRPRPRRGAVHEALTRLYGGVPDWGTFADSGVTAAVAMTDTGLAVPLRLGRWSGTSPNTGKSYDQAICEVSGPGSHEPDAVVRGTSADLDAWVWGRADASALTVEGDQAAFARLQEVIDQGIE